MIRLFGRSQILRSDECLDVVRTRPTLYQYGKPIAQPPFSFSVKCNVQPVNGRDLLLLPEHDRTREQLWVYTDNCQFKIDMGYEVDGASALMLNDRVIRNSLSYQVQSVENWGSYSRARIMQVDVGPNAPNNSGQA